MIWAHHSIQINPPSPPMRIAHRWQDYQRLLPLPIGFSFTLWLAGRNMWHHGGLSLLLTHLHNNATFPTSTCVSFDLERIWQNQQKIRKKRLLCPKVTLRKISFYQCQLGRSQLGAQICPGHHHKTRHPAPAQEGEPPKSRSVQNCHARGRERIINQ